MPSSLSMLRLRDAEHRGTSSSQPRHRRLLQQQVSCEPVEAVDDQHICLVALDQRQRRSEALASVEAVATADAFVGVDGDELEALRLAVVTDRLVLDVEAEPVHLLSGAHPDVPDGLGLAHLAPLPVTLLESIVTQQVDERKGEAS